MNLLFFILLLFILQIFCFYVGNKVSKKIKNESDYFLAGRSVKLFPLMMTFIATQIGGGLVLGAAEEAYRFGWPVLLYPLGACLGMIFLALGVGKKLAELGVTTIAEIFERVYSSALLKKLASLLSMLSLFMIFVAQILASKKFMISLGVESEWIFIGFWAIVIGYTVLGGLKAVIATDIVQALFFIGVFIATFSWIYLSPVVSSFSFSFQAVEQIDISTKWCGWLLMPLLFMVIEQDMGQRCFAAKSPKIVSSASLLAALIIMAICAIPVLLGILARTLQIPVNEGASVLMTVIKTLTNPFIAALVGCAILAAIISTVDSLINAISSHLSQDFRFSLFKSRPEKAVRSAQIVTIIIAALGLLFSYGFNNIVELLIQSYELSVSCLFIPLFFALFRPKGSVYSAAGAMIFGVFGFILFRIISLGLPKEVLSIMFSLLGYCVGMLYSRRIEVSATR